MSTLLEAHNQWAYRPADERFQTLEALRDSVHSRRMKSRSIDIECTRIVADTKDNLLTINGTIQPCEPTHWSFGQLSAMVKAPANYLRTLPQPLLVNCLNHGLQSGQREAVKFMTIERDGQANTLQAVTSPTYGRIWDADVVEAVQRIVEKSGGRFHNPLAYAHKGNANGFSTIDTSKTLPSGLYASDRDVFVFLIDGGSLLEAGPRAKLNRGFFAWNSEVGNRTFGLTTFLFNVVCGNNIVWGAQDVQTVKIKHTSGAPGRFDSEAMPALLEYVNASAKPIEDAIRKASDYLLPAIADLPEWTLKQGRFTKPEIKSAIDFAKAEEGDCRTLWQLVQGFTAYARGFDYVDARIDLETRAGKLLNIAAN